MKYPQIKLGEVADIKGGKRLPKGENLVDYNTGFPYIRAQDIKNGLITLKEPKFITPELRQKLKNYTVESNDVCITIVGAYVGDVGIVPNHLSGANLTENAVKLTNLKNDFNAQYLKYCLLSREAQEAMKKFGSGAAQDKLGIYKIKEIQIPNLPPEIQRKIAAILLAYDDLIENNMRRIEILEEMARSLYHEWFVNFRFPKREQVKMVNSELGPIPEGWEVVTLENLLKLMHGYAFKSEQLSKEKTSCIVVRMGNFKETGGLQVEDNIRYVEPGSFKEKYLLKPNDLVMAFSDVTRTGGIIGNVGLIPNDNNRYVLNQRVIKVDLPENLKPFFYIYFNSEIFKNYCLSRADSATVLNLRGEHIYQHKIVLPSQEVLSCFIKKVELIIRKIQNLSKRNINLRKTRDLLLPKLISGELDVENLDINTGEIAA